MTAQASEAGSAEPLERYSFAAWLLSAAAFLLPFASFRFNQGFTLSDLVLVLSLVTAILGSRHRPRPPSIMVLIAFLFILGCSLSALRWMSSPVALVPLSLQIIVTFVGLPMIATVQPLRRTLASFVYGTCASVLAGFGLLVTSRAFAWSFGPLQLSADTAGRVGFFTGPNGLGFLCVLALACRPLVGDTSLGRSAIVSLTLVSGLLISQSRAALVMAMVLVLFSILVFVRSVVVVRRVTASRKVVRTVMSAAVVGIGLSFVVLPRLDGRLIGSLFSRISSDGTSGLVVTEDRQQLGEFAAESFLAHPIIGIGYERVLELSPTGNTIHISFLHAHSIAGLLGMIAYGVAVMVLLQRSLRMIRESGHRIDCQALAAEVVASRRSESIAAVSIAVLLVLASLSFGSPYARVTHFVPFVILGAIAGRPNPTWFGARDPGRRLLSKSAARASRSRYETRLRPTPTPGPSRALGRGVHRGYVANRP